MNDDPDDVLNDIIEPPEMSIRKLSRKEKAEIEAELDDMETALLNPYVGESKAQVKFVTEDDTPLWVTRKFEKLARAEGLTYYEFMDKCSPSTDPTDWDNDAGSAEQAWA